MHVQFQNSCKKKTKMQKRAKSTFGFFCFYTPCKMPCFCIFNLKIPTKNFHRTKNHVHKRTFHQNRPKKALKHGKTLKYQTWAKYYIYIILVLYLLKHIFNTKLILE